MRWRLSRQRKWKLRRYRVWRLSRLEASVVVYRLRKKILTPLKLPERVTVDSLKIVCIKCKCGMVQSFSIVRMHGGCIYCKKDIDPDGSIKKHFGPRVMEALYKESFAWSIDPTWR